MPLNRGARVVRDTGYLVAGQVAGAGVGLVFAAWFARNLPAEELSLWPICVALTSVIHPLSNLGTHTAFMRTIPKLLERNEQAQAARMLRTAVLGTSILTVLTCIAFIPFAETANRALLNGELPVEVVHLVVIAVFARALESHFEWFLNGFQAYGILSTGRTVGRVLRPIAAFVFYILWGIEGSVWGLALGSFVGMAICAAGLIPRLRLSREMMPLSELLRLTGPFYLSQVYKGLINRADYIIVGALGGAENLALYYVASRVIEHLAELDMYLMETLTPKLAEKATQGIAAMERAFTKCSRYFFLIMLPVHIALAAVGPVIIRLYAGPGWTGAGVIFSILCLKLAVDCFYDLYRRQIVVAANRWHVLLLDSATKTLAVVLIALFTVAMGSTGAAVGQLVSVVVAVPIAVYLLRRIQQPRHSLSGVLLGLVGANIAVGTAILLQSVSDASIVALGAVPASFIAYLLFLQRRLEPDDVYLGSELIPERLVGAHTKRWLKAQLRRRYLQLPVGGEAAHEEIRGDGG